ncbi:MAG: uracil-DNA glycosylase, partial [Pseudomonadota bacterium]
MDQNAPDAALKALTEWWEDMGVEVDHAELKALSAKVQTPLSPVNAATSPQLKPPSEAPTRVQKRDEAKSLQDWITEATALANAATDLPSLKAVIENFEGCPLKKLCEKTVVYDGTVGAPVMVLGEGP